MAMGLVTPSLNAPVDSDNDGLTDTQEADLGTDPDNADSDGDGLEDGAEVALGTDPTASDTDGDGYTDGEEVDEGTSPTSAADALGRKQHSHLQGGYRCCRDVESLSALNLEGADRPCIESG